MSQWNRTIGDCSRRGYGYLRKTDENGNCRCCWCQWHAETLAQSGCSLFSTAKSLSEYWDRTLFKFAHTHGVDETALMFGVEPATVEFLLCHASQHVELDVTDIDFDKGVLTTKVLPSEGNKVVSPSGEIETSAAGCTNMPSWPEDLKIRERPALLATVLSRRGG